MNPTNQVRFRRGRGGAGAGAAPRLLDGVLEEIPAGVKLSEVTLEVGDQLEAKMVTFLLFNFNI